MKTPFPQVEPLITLKGVLFLSAVQLGILGVILLVFTLLSS